MAKILTCSDRYNCCDCGGQEDDSSCGCSYCLSCNACENCKNDTGKCIFEENEE